ncbi:RES family NAD+ phosphorylase [Treponema sp.]|uniref:RES family NAD+ phosphorylase n=1 Tax=Treponema sp. TaxID=166 RepID=UPI0025D9DC21|nr:RES family NAD+ phosphorylase [Treponema sp.]MCR5217109.1 RES family NAD+ phosphorylase [Treponema sp.]
MAENFFDRNFYNTAALSMEEIFLKSEKSSQDIKHVFTVLKNFDRMTIAETKECFMQLMGKYRDTFCVRSIAKGEEFFRARLGCNKEKGSIGKKSIEVLTPYFGEQMEIPPTSLAGKGRFNRDGVAFLYLSSNAHTCVSELKLDVGQLCSVCRFINNKKYEYLDLTQQGKSLFAELIKVILLNPVYSENKNYYLFTESLSSVIRRLGFRGILYPSTQSTDENNYNLVCFYPSDFSFVEYSDQLYKVQSVQYSIEAIKESFRNYEGYEKLLSEESDTEKCRKQSIFTYIKKKICFEKRLKKN